MKTITTLVIILLEYTAIIRLNYTLEHIIHTSTLHCNFIILTYLLTYCVIKFSRLQHPAMGAGRDLLGLAPLSVCMTLEMYITGACQSIATESVQKPDAFLFMHMSTFHDTFRSTSLLIMTLLLSLSLTPLFAC